MPSQAGNRSRLSLLRLSLIAAAAVLAVPLMVPLLTWRIFPSGDLLQFHLPMRFIYQDALRHGDSFLWTPALGSGVYVHGEGQTGMAHPFHLLLYGVLPLTAAFNIEMLASYFAAAMGMWLLMRRLGFSADAAVAGALMFAFSGFNLLHLNHVNMIAVLAHVPWLLWATDLVLKGGTRRARAFGFFGTAATLGSQVLLGFPQAVWLGALCLAWYLAWLAFSGIRWRRLLLLGTSLAAGALIGAVQLLPTLDLVRSSLRSETTMAFRLSFSLHPVNLLQLVSPYLLDKRIYAPAPDEHFLHEFCIYDGAFATVGLCWIALRWRALKHRRQVLAFLFLAALGLVLALGRYGGLYTLLAHLPGLSNLRGPTRHILLVHVAFAGLAAAIVDDLLDLKERIPWRRLSPLLIPAFLSVAISLLLPVAARAPWLSARGVLLGQPEAVLTGTAFIVATAGLFALAGRGFRHVLPVLVLLVAIDLAWWGTRYLYEQAPITVAEAVPVRGLPPGAEPHDLVRPTAVRNDMNLYAMWHLRSSTVYLGLTPATVVNPYRPIAKRIAGVKWDWTPQGWMRVEGTMPRARLVSDWRVSSDVASDVERIDIARTALVLESPGELSGPPGTARVVSDRPGVLAVETEAPAPQLLVLTERFDHGWRADIDATSSAGVVPIYGDYMGCVVPAGTHRVTFTFSPASARDGLWITLAGLALTVAGTGLIVKL